ncbi:hypothetical protein [Halorubrum trueperi]|uniref:Uncharacterized protein n=1 Tax=Halorubrum trueperi TaxID=2004704 RepID=A0ABD5UHV6_9EURY
MQTHTLLQVGGLAESFSQVVVVAGAVVLLLMLAALSGFAYKSLRGGIEWPDEQSEDDDDDGVSRASDDEEWKFS